ncbi:hypothetical protein [Pseudomonas prosekii]|nr:hypothetical protein [Pseudomonas prosekii]
MSSPSFSRAIGTLVLFNCAVLMAEQDCLSTWKDNPVSQSCKAYVTAAAPDQITPLFEDLQDGQCAMTVTCKNRYGGGTPNLGVQFKKTDLLNLHNCNGEMQVEPCRFQ